MNRGANFFCAGSIWGAVQGALASYLPNSLSQPEKVSFIGRLFPLSAAREHFARLREWGLTFLRFVITWEAVEHAGPGMYDHAYLDYLTQVIQMAQNFYNGRYTGKRYVYDQRLWLMRSDGSMYEPLRAHVWDEHTTSCTHEWWPPTALSAGSITVSVLKNALLRIALNTSSGSSFALTPIVILPNAIMSVMTIPMTGISGIV